MKINPIKFLAFPLLTLLVGCQNHPRPCADEVICQTHLHRYGVPLDCDDWCSRGQNGQVISTLKNGVVVVRNYDKGILHGETTYTFPYRSIIQKREVFEQGILVETTENYVDGLPKSEFTYLSGDGNYSVMSWYRNGAPQSRETIEDGKLVTGIYYDLNNNVESSVIELNGLRTIRDGEGLLNSIQTIKDGEMILETSYHPNGSPLAIATFFKGKIEGERRTYMPSGEPCTIETWKNNCQEGLTTQFEFGVRVAEVPYINGMKQGIERRYSEDGETLVAETNWIKGQRHGKCYSYLGGVKKEDWYFKDQLVNKPTYDMLCSQ